jgi:hypothetical protein
MIDMSPFKYSISSSSLNRFSPQSLLLLFAVVVLAGTGAERPFAVSAAEGGDNITEVDESFSWSTPI